MLEGGKAVFSEFQHFNLEYFVNKYKISFKETYVKA